MKNQPKPCILIKNIAAATRIQSRHDKTPNVSRFEAPRKTTDQIPGPCPKQSSYFLSKPGLTHLSKTSKEIKTEEQIIKKS
jgi:hypothetical protein